MTHEQTSVLQHTPEAEALADAILKASGSALKHYSMQKTRDEIFAAAQAGIDTAQTELLEALEVAEKEIRAWREGINTRQGLKDLGNAKIGACFGGIPYISAAIAKARGQV